MPQLSLLEIRSSIAFKQKESRVIIKMHIVLEQFSSALRGSLIVFDSVNDPCIDFAAGGGATGYAGWAMAYPAAQQMQASHDSPAPP